MKNRSVPKLALLCTLAAFACTVPAHADDAVKKPKEPKITQKVLNKYDKNHNGKLDADEEAAWKADLAKARADREARKKADAPELASK